MVKEMGGPGERYCTQRRSLESARQKSSQQRALLIAECQALQNQVPASDPAVLLVKLTGLQIQIQSLDESIRQFDRQIADCESEINTIIQSEFAQTLLRHYSQPSTAPPQPSRPIDSAAAIITVVLGAILCLIGLFSIINADPSTACLGSTLIGVGMLSICLVPALQKSNH